MKMNQGKIMVGISLIVLSGALMVSPPGANRPYLTCTIPWVTSPREKQAGTDTVPGTSFIVSAPVTDATYPYER